MKPVASALIFAALAGYVVLSVGKAIPWGVHVVVGFAWLCCLGVIYEGKDGGRGKSDP